MFVLIILAHFFNFELFLLVFDGVFSGGFRGVPGDPWNPLLARLVWV